MDSQKLPQEKKDRGTPEEVLKRLKSIDESLFNLIKELESRSEIDLSERGVSDLEPMNLSLENLASSKAESIERLSNMREAFSTIHDEFSAINNLQLSSSETLNSKIMDIVMKVCPK